MPRSVLGRAVRKGTRLVLYALPAINVAADRLIGYLGEWNGIHAGHVRSALLLLFIALWLPLLRVTRTNRAVLIFLVYLTCLVPFASDLALTLTQYHKVFVSAMLFCIAYVSLSDWHHLRALHLGVYGAVVVVVVHFALVQGFQVGPSPYVEGVGVYWGPREGREVYQAYVLAYGLILYPATVTLWKVRFPGAGAFRTLLLTMSVGIMVLLFRRSAILAVACGGLIYLILSGRTVPYAKVLVGVLALGAAAWPWYGAAVSTLVDARADIVAFVRYTDTGRMAEFSTVFQAFADGSVRHKLFGTDLFNSWTFFGVERPIHIDYLQLLAGAGVVGLALYSLVYIDLFRNVRRRLRSLPVGTVRRELGATSVAMIVGALVLGLGQQLLVLTPFSLFLTYMGGVLGVLAKTPDPAPWQRSGLG